MRKQKTRKSILKRFKITGRGKLLRGHQLARHRRSHKSKRRIRHFARTLVLKGRQTKFIKQLINIKRSKREN